MSYGDILTVSISAIAAGVPLVTFVYTLTLKARVELQIGEEIALHYTGNYAKVAEDLRMRLILRADFVFLNKGAQPAAMTGLYGTVWPRGSPQPDGPNLAWLQYEKTERDPGTSLGSAARYRSGSSGMVETTVIPGHKVVTARVRLYSQSRMVLSETDYMLKLKAADGSARKGGGSLNCWLHLSTEDVTDLAENGAERDGMIQARISLKKRMTARNDSGARLLNPRKFGGIVGRMFPSRHLQFDSGGRLRDL